MSIGLFPHLINPSFLFGIGGLLQLVGYIVTLFAAASRNLIADEKTKSIIKPIVSAAFEIALRETLSNENICRESAVSELGIASSSRSEYGAVNECRFTQKASRLLRSVVKYRYLFYDCRRCEDAVVIGLAKHVMR